MPSASEARNCTVKEMPAGSSFWTVTDPPDNAMIRWATGGPRPRSPRGIIERVTANTSKIHGRKSGGIVRPVAEIRTWTGAGVSVTDSRIGAVAAANRTAVCRRAVKA